MVREMVRGNIHPVFVLMAGVLCGLCVITGGVGGEIAQAEEPMSAQVPENLYRAELVSYPGPWGFLIGRSHIILVTDEELEALADPDKPVNLSLSHEKHEDTLRKICERAKAAGQRTLIVAFDHFFSQYRPGLEGKNRRLTPDMDEYVDRIAAISRFAQGYGLGLELSLLSPLEVGKVFAAKTGDSGMWMHYRKGLRDPKTGAFSVQLWRQQRWANNKGPIDVEDAGVRVFAFKETAIHGTSYKAVDPNSIVELTPGVEVEVFDNVISHSGGDYRAQRIRVHGRIPTKEEGLDRVLIVQQYRTPEMDYFSDKALLFLTSLIDKYAAAGVKLNALYSDEMHIQQDWAYFGHHDNGEFALRYVSKGLAKKYADLFGGEYQDFAKYLVYFAYGQEDSANDLSAKEGIMHAFGPTSEAVRKTALFRTRYYHLLQDGVVDLFVQAKRYAEQKMGYKLEARAHATWAESPTIDKWNVGRQNHARNQYEYTSNFVWSDTVHQSASACSDYFKWGDFLTGNGNDHAEGGWIDRDYFALALACSTGILNDVPYSYAAHWGMPGEISRRRSSLVNAYGAAGSPMFGMVQDMQHRDVDVLMLYPIDLVAVEERFGSWMTQYGYANMVTAAKLLERGKVVGGAIEMAGRRFTTLATMFEPFPSERLLELMTQLVEQGGRVIWSGPPPMMTLEGAPNPEAWRSLFGVESSPDAAEGIIAPGKQVKFEGALASVAPQIILTDFVVDHIHPVIPAKDALPVARVKDWIVGTHRIAASKGSATYLGYRPRDDQSRSLGYETRNWFETLSALGAYPSTGHFPDFNDNTEHLSRTTDYLTCRFPNGAVAIARHFRDVEENWSGGFARKQDEDRAYMEKNPAPTEAINLKDFRVNGHTVTYDGTQTLCFRANDKGELTAFAGNQCKQITIDGRTTVFADQELPLVAWAPVSKERRVDGGTAGAKGAVLQIMVHGTGTVRIPALGLPDSLEIVAEGPTPGSRGAVVPSRRENDALVFAVAAESSGRWLYGVSPK